MEQQQTFQTALSNFAADAAYGGAIRHLTDIGYTLDQIVDRLDYPAPKAKVQKIMMEHLYESKVLLRGEPSEELFTTSGVYVQEQDAFGRRSIRKIQEKEVEKPQKTVWKDICYASERSEKLTVVLHRKCEQNGEEYSYISYRFGSLESLNNRQRAYLEGLQLDETVVYHRLDQRMREIISRLYDAGEYHGTAYFIKIREKMKI